MRPLLWLPLILTLGCASVRCPSGGCPTYTSDDLNKNTGPSLYCSGFAPRGFLIGGNVAVLVNFGPGLAWLRCEPTPLDQAAVVDHAETAEQTPAAP